jgi:hypothetical protein
MVCGMSSTRVGVYIEGLVLKFVIFCNFFRIFWTPNGQKRLVATASTRGPIRSQHVDQSDRATSLSPALSPRQCLARAGAPAGARARRYRPLSPGASAIARRRPLARARAAAASSRPRCRPHCHQPNNAPNPALQLRQITNRQQLHLAFQHRRFCVRASLIIEFTVGPKSLSYHLEPIIKNIHIMI